MVSNAIGVTLFILGVLLFIAEIALMFSGDVFITIVGFFLAAITGYVLSMIARALYEDWVS